MQIALALYPGFTVLDIIGRFKVLADVPGHEVVFVAGEAGPVTDHAGRCLLVASTTFADATAPDVVVVPGELFAELDDRVVQWLREVHPMTTLTTSVCTGSLYLAAAGILDGVGRDHSLGAGRTTRAARRPLHRATRGRTGQRDHRSRCVDRHRMAITLLDRLIGPEVAQLTQLGIEYDPHRRFDAGSPSKGAVRTRRDRQVDAADSRTT